MLKNVIKFSVFTLAIVALGAIALYGIQFYRYKNSPEYRVLKDMENLKKQYAEDPYGGDTPEETLRLFIDALKSGDTDLAAKYFILDKQQEWRKDLAQIKDKGLLKNVTTELENTKLTKKTEEEAFFTLVNKDNIADAELIIGKNIYNKRWKIYEL